MFIKMWTTNDLRRTTTEEGYNPITKADLKHDVFR